MRDGGSFLADGFVAGQRVWISGLAGPWTIGPGLSAATMPLLGAALAPTLSMLGDTLAWFAPSLTVFGYDVGLDGGVRMGGDTIKVCNSPTSTTVRRGARRPRLAARRLRRHLAGRRLVRRHPDDVLGYEFGPKPFDPFTRIPDGENEDDEWVFPLADPFDFAGNDVIDASGLFAGIVCNAACATCRASASPPTAAPGNDLIIGSQAGDHLAGGSGDDTILGLRGVDHIYGDSGVNVDILTRGLTIAVVDATPAADARPAQPGRRPDAQAGAVAGRRQHGRRPRRDLRRRRGHGRWAGRRAPTTT